jgi:hypothetical protein
MKRHILLIGYLMAMSFLWFGCQPVETDKPSIGAAPTPEQLHFVIAPGSDDFHFKVINTSDVKGIANWNLGNGSKAVGDTVVAYFPLAQSYTVKLTLYTSGGTATISQDFAQTKTDYTYFEDPLLIALCGGTEAVNGKTWVLDSLEAGHLGVGPADAVAPTWWSANPLDKTGFFIYDDEFNFNLVGFSYSVNTHGKTLTALAGASLGRTVGYYGVASYSDANDEVVTTYDASRGDMTWMVDKVGDTYYIKFGQTGAVFGYDAGHERVYEVLDYNENYLYVKSVNDAEARYDKFIPKGYAKPAVTFDYGVVATANPNEYSFSLANVLVPDGFTINSITYDFGDGVTQVATSTSDAVTYTYMRKGVYPTSVKINTSNGDFTKTYSLTVENNSPDYVPYLLDAMVMYNDFGETTLIPMAFDQSDGGGSIGIVDNPDASLYPDRSAHVLHVTKANAQWANAYTLLPAGYRFNLTLQTTFKLLVYGNAGDVILLKMENTDYGGNAWTTGTNDLTYTIQQSNKWEIAEFNFAGIGAGSSSTGQIYTSDITTDSRFNDNFYNVVRIMINPGNNAGTFSFYMDDLAGPHVEGLK